NATSFDDVCDNADDIMASAVSYTHELLGKDPTENLIGEICFAGWSDKLERALHCWWLAYDKTYDSGATKKRGLYQSPPDFNIVGPMPSPDLYKVAWDPEDMPTTKEKALNDIDDLALSFICLQRQNMLSIEGHTAVGGAVQIVELGQGYINSRCIHRF